MKKHAIILSLAVVLISVFGGCKKTEDKNKSFDPNILTNHTWKVTAFTIDPAMDINDDGIIDNDPYAIWYGDACWQSNFVTFKPDFTAHWDKLCGEMFQDFTWSFVENNTKLKFGIEAMPIIKLDDTNLIVQYDINDGVLMHKATVTYTAR